MQEAAAPCVREVRSGGMRHSTGGSGKGKGFGAQAAREEVDSVVCPEELQADIFAIKMHVEDRYHGVRDEQLLWEKQALLRRLAALQARLDERCSGAVQSSA